MLQLSRVGPGINAASDLVYKCVSVKASNHKFILCADLSRK